jgi:hypothetical protein
MFRRCAFAFFTGVILALVRFGISFIILSYFPQLQSSLVTVSRHFILQPNFILQPKPAFGCSQVATVTAPKSVSRDSNRGAANDDACGRLHYKAGRTHCNGKNNNFSFLLSE